MVFIHSQKSKTMQTTDNNRILKHDWLMLNNKLCFIWKGIDLKSKIKGIKILVHNHIISDLSWYNDNFDSDPEIIVSGTGTCLCFELLGVISILNLCVNFFQQNIIYKVYEYNIRVICSMSKQRNHMNGTFNLEFLIQYLRFKYHNLIKIARRWCFLTPFGLDSGWFEAKKWTYEFHVWVWC